MAKKNRSNTTTLRSKIPQKNPVRKTAENKPVQSTHRESQHYSDVYAAPLTNKRWFGIVITIALILILSLIGSMDNIVEKWTGLLAGIVILALLFTVARRREAWRNALSPLFFAFTAYIIWAGISTFYAASGKFAIFEFSKLLVAFCIFLAVIFLSGSNEVGFKRVSYVFSIAGCLFGIISVDAASWGVLSKIFKVIMIPFTSVYGDRGGFEQGIRINSIFDAPNIYAGIMALAVLLSLYLVVRAADKRNILLSTVLLAINALSFLLAFSMGTLFMFFLACLVMIGFTEKGKRTGLFLLMLETAVLGFMFAFISMIGLGKSGVITILPILALILNALLLCLIDGRLRPLLSEKLNANIKLLISAVIVIIVLIAGFIIAALQISGEMNLNANETVMRAIYVPTGEYTLELESSAPLNVRVESQNEYDLMRHTSTILFAGNSSRPIPFNVPADSRIVQISFSASGSTATISKAAYTGAESGNIHLNYPLLPDFIANRIQNLFANENAVQRTIFFEDGMKLFAKSPIIGRGLGGFENGVCAVQDFFYETKYAHNHYVQVLSDLGLIGFLLFLSLLVFSILGIIKSKRKGRSLAVVPVLAACVIQMFGHGLVEAIWSTGAYQGFAACVLALITVHCSEPIIGRGSLSSKDVLPGKGLYRGTKGVISVFVAVFVVLLSGNLYAQDSARSSVKNFDEIKELLALDRFEYNDYKLSYIVSAPAAGDESVIKQADIYAKELSEVESNSIAPYVMAYYLKLNKDGEAFETAWHGIENVKSDSRMWIRIFNTLEEYIDPVGPNRDAAVERLGAAEKYIDQVLEFYYLLQERNQDALDDIMLTPANNAFLGKMLKIKESGNYKTSDVMKEFIANAFDSSIAVDANQDNMPDGITVVSGSAQGSESGVISVSDNTTLNLELWHKFGTEYTFRIETPAPQGIMIEYNGHKKDVTYIENEAYVTLILEDNSDGTVSRFKVTCPHKTDLKSITFRAKLDI